MRIHKVKLSNFGPHKSLDLDFDAPVIGILGDNGSGKSNIRHAIRFALTGILRDPQDTYIRGHGVNLDLLSAMAKEAGKKDKVFKPATAAEVFLDFSMNGQRGTIERKITKTSSSRKLVWADGEPLTSATKVAEALDDILGADKTAISEIVFPEQGSLSTLLSGTQAAREDLFVRLLLMTHCAKVSDLAEQQAKILRSQIADMSVQRDQLNDILSTATAKLKETEAEFAKLEGWGQEIEYLRKRQSCEADLHRSRYKLDALQNSLRDYQQKALQALNSITVDAGGNPIQLRDVDHLEQVIASYKEDLNTITEVANYQKKMEAVILQKKAIEDSVASLTERLSDSKAALNNVNQELAGMGDNADVIKLNKRRDISVSHSRDWLAKKTNEDKLLEVERGLPAAEAELIAATTEDTHAQELLRLTQRTEDMLSTKVDAMEIGCKAGGSTCVLCGSQYSASQEKLAEMILEHDASVLDRKNAEVRSKEAVLRLASARAAVDRLKHEQSRCMEIRDTLSHVTDDVAEDVSYLDKLILQAQTLKARKDNLEGATGIPQIEQDIAKYNETLSGLPDCKDFHEGILAGAVANQEKLTAFLNSAGAVLNSVLNLKGSVQATSVEIAEVSNDISEYESRQKDLLASMSSRVMSVLEHTPDLDRAILFMETRNNEYLRSEGDLRQARAQIADINERYKRLEEREAEDAVKARVAEELMQVKEAFSRKGLPMAYVQDRFEVLIVLVNRNLESLDANFEVMVDPDKFVSMNFTRTDDSSGVIMGANKLSGGQEVRLAIALLLAIQQLIIPDLGLLTLDEPSMHLTSEGVESLADLLVNMGAQLKSTESQIIVIDHNHRLERAFGKTVTLS